MHVLTSGWSGRGMGVVPAKPEVFAFEAYGRKFVFDAHTIALALVDDAKIPDGFATACKPAYPPACLQAPGCILLNMTNRCNLRCEYCMIPQDAARTREDGEHLDLETVELGLSKILPRNFNQAMSLRGQLSIAFFGGEPLLRFALIKKMVPWLLQRINTKLKFHVTTNGTLIKEEIAKFLSHYAFSAIVSMDGPEAAHDHMRKYRNGRGSFKDVLAGLETLGKYAKNVSAATTLRGTFSANALKICSLQDRLEYLNDLCDRGLGSHVSVEPVFLGESACVDGNFAKEMTPEIAGSEGYWAGVYHSAAEWWLERFRNRKRPRFHHFNAYMRRLVMGEVHSSECGSGKGYFSISPGGNIYACHREADTKIGHVSYGIDHELAAPWYDNRYYARLRCPTCPLRNFCGGGCREQSSSSGLGVSMPRRAECEFKMVLLREIAWLLSEILGPDHKAEDRDFLLQVLNIPTRGKGRTCASRSS